MEITSPGGRTFRLSFADVVNFSCNGGPNEDICLQDHGPVAVSGAYTKSTFFGRNELSTFIGTGDVDSLGLGFFQFGSSLEPISSFNIVENIHVGEPIFNVDVDFDMGPATLKVDYIYSPVPIPASIWLFGSGLLGVIGISRNKKVRL